MKRREEGKKKKKKKRREVIEKMRIEIAKRTARRTATARERKKIDE